MVTLTYPGEWRSVAGDGLAVKRHMKAFYRRLGRYFSARGAPGWSALWFLEFQRRGAPHLHLILWRVGLDHGERREFRRWVAVAWSEIVGHADSVERARHLRAGTRVEQMRVKHFGYAVKYAQKCEQKLVPDGFSSVGRFWGLWNAPKPAPAVFSVPVSLSRLGAVVDALSLSVEPFSLRFAARLRGRFLAVAERGGGFGASVWGPGAVAAVLDALDTS